MSFVQLHKCWKCGRSTPKAHLRCTACGAFYVRPVRMLLYAATAIAVIAILAWAQLQAPPG